MGPERLSKLSTTSEVRDREWVYSKLDTHPPPFCKVGARDLELQQELEVHDIQSFFRFASSWRRSVTALIPITREVFMCLTAFRCTLAESLDLRLGRIFPASETNRFSSRALRKSSTFDKRLWARLPRDGALRDWRSNERFSSPTNGAMPSTS